MALWLGFSRLKASPLLMKSHPQSKGPSETNCVLAVVAGRH